MRKSTLVLSLCCAASLSLAVGSIALAKRNQDVPAMQLPPGWTMDDVQACMIAGTPGEMHEHLKDVVGTWEGKTSMVMAPGMPAMESVGTMTAEMIMDGRYLRITNEGDMPGMGPYKGQGVYGFDNVSQKFVGVWYDNMGTGLMVGTGALSADGKSMTTNYTYNCPINKRPAPIREVDTKIDDNTRRLEMYSKDPKSGEEFKMMSIEYKRKA